MVGRVTPMRPERDRYGCGRAEFAQGALTSAARHEPNDECGDAVDGGDDA